MASVFALAPVAARWEGRAERPDLRPVTVGSVCFGKD